MKLPMPTSSEISQLAERAEGAINCTNSRHAHKQLVENAIRSALQIVIDRMDIQIPQPIGLDLGKA